MKASTREAWVEFFGVFFGALLGAYFGYLFTLHLQDKETDKQRTVLVRVLRAELKQIADEPAPYDATKAFYIDPIRIGAPDRLLDGKVLDAKEDGELASLLLVLNGTISVFNDFVLVTNQAQANGDPPLAVHAKWYSDMSQRLHNVIQVKNRILEITEKDNGGGA